MRLITFAIFSVAISQKIPLNNPVCSGWEQKSDCTDDIDGAVYWDEIFDENQNIIIENKAVIIRSDVTAKKIRIGHCGYLTVQDGIDIKFRAMHIDVSDGGSLKIGSETCRHNSDLDIELYGTRAEQLQNDETLDKNIFCDHGHCEKIHKAILVLEGGLIEIHGKEKMSWTHLSDHLFAKNQPVPVVERVEKNWQNIEWGPRIVLHILNAEGDLREVNSFRMDGVDDECAWNKYCQRQATVADIEFFLDSHFDNPEYSQDIVLGFTTGFTEITKEMADYFDALVPAFGGALHAILSDPIKSKYSQMAFVVQNEMSRAALSSPSGKYLDNPLNHEFNIDLKGDKKGYDMIIRFSTFWDAKGSKGPLDVTKPGFNVYDELKNYEMKLIFTSNYDEDAQPIITIDGVTTSWEIGDKIVIASTDFDPRHSEVFTIIDCENKCGLHQLKLDRPAEFNHWGRLDGRSGLDQRAEVGLLTRNIKFYGSDTGVCEYAESRCSGEAEDGPCPGNRVPKAEFAVEGNSDPMYCYNENTRMNCESKNFCSILIDNEPENGKKDFHGANFFFRGGTRNTQLSHLELFNVGQAQLARYPVHFHFDKNHEYRLNRYGETRKQTVSHLSIHDANSRFITVHQTNDTVVRDVVGYNTFGHGFFIEDGVEENNLFEHNLGILVKPGIILPTDRSNDACLAIGKEETYYWDTPNGRQYERVLPGNCEMLSVFWISNANNAIHNNAAVGGEAGFWAFAHIGETTSPDYRLKSPPRDENGISVWRNNKASACMDGLRWQFVVKNDHPSAKCNDKYCDTSSPRLSKYQSSTWIGGVDPTGTWSGDGLVNVTLDGWKVHHTFGSGMWIEQQTISVINSQFSDTPKGLLFANRPRFWGTVKRIARNLFQGSTKNIGSLNNLLGGETGGFVTYQTPRYRLDEEKPLPLPGSHAITSTFLKGDLLRQSFWGEDYNQRGLIVYEADTMPLWIEGNRFFDFYGFGEEGFRSGIELRLNLISQAMVSHQCFMKQNEYSNVKYRMNFARMNSTISGGDDDNKYRFYGIDMGNYGDDGMDWMEPQRRIYAEGEISMGCIDLDGTTVGQKGDLFLVNHIKKSDFVDGPDCFMDRVMNANICPYENHQQLATNIRGINSPTSAVRHFLMQSHHVIQNNESDWITMVTASPGVAKTVSTNLVTFQANQTYLVTSPPGTEVYPKYDVTLSSANQFDWIHIAICLKGGIPSKVQQQYTFVRDDVFKQTISKNEAAVIKIHPELKKLVEYDTLEEFHQCEAPCWFFSQSDGWIHLKLIEYADRKANGTVFGDLINEEQNFAYDGNEFFECSPEYGCAKILFEVDATDAQSENKCPIFNLDENDVTKVELCTDCISHEDCGSWNTNHMKCQEGKCICGDNWLPNQYNRCRVLNNLPRPNEQYDQFYPSMCEDIKSCDVMLDECIANCQSDQDCIHSCLRDHADCSSN